jgi:hypothetical protein
MFLIVVLVLVGGVSFVAACMLRHGSGQKQPIGNDPGFSLRSKWTAIGALTTTSLTVAVFIPLLFVAYVAIGLVRHALGQ